MTTLPTPWVHRAGITLVLGDHRVHLRPRYGLELRPGYTWLDVAEMLNAVADGPRMRAKNMGSVAALSTGDNVVVGAIRACCQRCSPTRTPRSPRGPARADARARHARYAAVSDRPLPRSLVVQPLPSLDGARR